MKEKGFASILFIMITAALAITGCVKNAGVTPSDKEEPVRIENSGIPAAIKEERTSEETAELYRDIYENDASNPSATSAGSATSYYDRLPVIRQIVERLGSYGYAAIDSENKNQLNMVNPGLIEDFCRKVEEQKEACATLFSVMENLGFIRFDFVTSEEMEGKVHVTRSVLCWIGGMPRVTDKYSYNAAVWEYTKEGYLFFEENTPVAYDGPPGYTAVRVKPLEEECRELNRRYILPIGYGANNMFLTDWKEENFGELDFYDLFQLLYPFVYYRNSPYGLTVDGAKYRVPEEEFNRVIMTYFNIDEETLHSSTKYLAEGKYYEYLTRSFLDYGNSPNTPWPEVTSRKENADGTITLTVSAVWPQRHLGRAMSSEVVIRPLEDGGFQYVSNRIIDSPENVEPDWYEIPNRKKMSSVISAALLPAAPSLP